MTETILASCGYALGVIPGAFLGVYLRRRKEFQRPDGLPYRHKAFANTKLMEFADGAVMVHTRLNMYDHYVSVVSPSGLGAYSLSLRMVSTDKRLQDSLELKYRVNVEMLAKLYEMTHHAMRVPLHFWARENEEYKPRDNVLCVLHVEEAAFEDMVNRQQWPFAVGDVPSRVQGATGFPLIWEDAQCTR